MRICILIVILLFSCPVAARSGAKNVTFVSEVLRKMVRQKSSLSRAVEQLLHTQLPLTCANWHLVEHEDAEFIAAGGHRQVFGATLNGRALVVKQASAAWQAKSSPLAIAKSMLREAAALSHHRSPSLPRLYGYCIRRGANDGGSNDRGGGGGGGATYAIAMERVVQWSELVQRELTWTQRVRLIASGLDLLRFWRHRRELDKQGVFLWDVKPINFGANAALTRLKVVDMETLVWNGKKKED